MPFVVLAVNGFGLWQTLVNHLMRLLAHAAMFAVIPHLATLVNAALGSPECIGPFVLHFFYTNISEKHSTVQYDSNVHMLSNAETDVLSTCTSQSSIASDATPIYGRN